MGKKKNKKNKNRQQQLNEIHEKETKDFFYENNSENKDIVSIDIQEQLPESLDLPENDNKQEPINDKFIETEKGKQIGGIKIDELLQSNDTDTKSVEIKQRMSVAEQRYIERLSEKNIVKKYDKQDKPVIKNNDLPTVSDSYKEEKTEENKKEITEEKPQKPAVFILKKNLIEHNIPEVFVQDEATEETEENKLSFELTEEHKKEIKKSKNQKKFDKLTAENQDLKARVEDLKNQIAQMTEIIDKKSQETEETKKQLSKVLSMNAILKQEVANGEKILKIQENTATRDHKDTLTRIAKSLKIEYEDFESAKDMEMSVNLGENLREQIKNIFKILSQYGINVNEE